MSREYWEYVQREYHRDKLVELGALEFERFVFRHLDVGYDAKREGRHFSRVLLNHGPPSVDARWNWPPTVAPLELSVWTDLGGMQAWREFVARYDVPNYWEIRNQSVTLDDADVNE